MRPSQELEDERDDDEMIPYPFTQVVPPQPMTVNPPTILERITFIAIIALLVLMLWIICRGIFLSTRELWRLL